MALLADGRADAIAAQGAAVDSCTAQDATANACASAARNAHAEAGGGDYAPRHLDPHAAIAILVSINVSMALSQSIVAEAGVLALAIASMLYCRRYAAIARWLAAYALFAVLVHLFLMSGSTLLSPFAASLLMFRHVLPAFMFASNTIATTRLGELACALQAVHVPANVSVAICVAFRFLPTMGREFSAVNDAMKTRGIAISPKSLLLHPAQTAEHFLVPVMARLGTVADELGNAMECAKEAAVRSCPGDMGAVRKRDGRMEPYKGRKITEAMRRAFEDVDGAGQAPASELPILLANVERAMERDGVESVEEIQDLVERALMERGHFDVAKSYILYRHHRAEKRAARLQLARAVAQAPQGDAAGASSLAGELEAVLARIQRDYPQEPYGLGILSARFHAFTGAGQDEPARLEALIRAAVELTSQEAPRWEFIAARLRSFVFNRDLARARAALGIDTFPQLVHHLTDEGLYGSYILAAYSTAELEQAASYLDSARDDLFTYSGIDLLVRRYVICGHDHTPLESPQEMFLGMALHLAMNEDPGHRLAWVRRFYDMLSKLEVTMATPTMSNARKPDHQLSSCFIDTVPDSLVGIYRSIDNFAQVSKYGGGMGMYLGKVRATGGNIRGFEGVAGGVIRWIRVINDTAVAVDQLGMRQGAVAVYLDAWHRDLPEFLSLRTNNGDDRMKAHDVFPAVCYPDLFWRMAEESLDQPWHLMCPHDILTVKGYTLEDSYGEEWERRYRDCIVDPRIPKRTILIKDLVRLILKSAVETGTPFTFMRDTVNRANPNGHEGIIYCSNLCTEIAQNTSAIQEVAREVRTDEGDSVVVTTTRPGDFVVCNLASLSLGRLPVEDDAAMGRVVETAVRALDNVIDLNFYALPYARVTNHRYRSIGLGVSGYHHMLARRGIRWESDEHLEFADEVFERINYHAIAASERLAEERGAYGLIEGSDWQTGAYFVKRGYLDNATALDAGRWRELAARVADHGVRNAYLLAVAPTSSTSILSGTTPGIDPVMRKFFLEEKKGAMLPRVAPELSPQTLWYYKPAHHIDQHWSVRATGVRQRHIDQAQSMNLYITNDYSLRQVLDLYIDAWRQGVKTIYYVRSKSLEVEECESCSA